MNKRIDIFSEKDLFKLSSLILTNYFNRIIAISGDLGAGKTTLIKNLCLQLRVNEVVSSPTFPIINEYLSEDGEKIFHFDFYRLNSIQEALDIGTDLYLNSGCFCFIEWPELIIPLLDDNVLFLHLKLDNKKRVLTIK